MMQTTALLDTIHQPRLDYHETIAASASTSGQNQAAEFTSKKSLLFCARWYCRLVKSLPFPIRN